MNLGDHLPPIVKTALAGVGLLLVAATVLVGALRRWRPTATLADAAVRIRSWWVMAGIFAAALLLSRTATLVFLGFVSFMALKEYFSLIPTRRADRRVLFWAYLAIPVQYYWVATGWYGMFIIFIPVYMFLLLPFRMILVGETAGYVRAVGTLHWGLMTMVFCLSHLAWLFTMPAARPGVPPGPALVLYVVFLTQFNDVAQYIWGKSFGRTRIVPTVSPNKTWVGFLGGLVTTVALAALLAPHFTPLDRWQAVLSGAIIGAGGFVGDAAMASLKRDIGVKDSGSILPGHGGVLDRVNSLVYTAPLFLHFVRYLQY